jgi:hypothetical protein
MNLFSSTSTSTVSDNILWKGLLERLLWL